VAILARECGLMLELSDVPVESLVPEPLRALKDPSEYMARLPEFDTDMGVGTGYWVLSRWLGGPLGWLAGG
jgi:hypothetical protein